MGKNKKKKQVVLQPDSLGKKDFSALSFSKSLDENKQMIFNIFLNDQTLVSRDLLNQSNGLKCCIFFIDGMVKNDIINDYVIRSYLTAQQLPQGKDLLETIRTQVLTSNAVEQTVSIQHIVDGILYGDTVLLVEGAEGALIINTKGFQIRAVAEPDTEKSLRGPREGFTECLLVNLSLIRRKLRTSDLKVEFMSFGTRSNTQTCLCYLESLTDKKILRELKRRLKRIDMDGVLDSNYITEQIKDHPLSPFKTVGITEKPDVLAAKLLEGRIALFVDGSPVVLTVPFLLIENFQSGDDYYLNYYFASFDRMLKILSFFISVSVPAIYIALTTYHREMIPTALALNIAKSRHDVPLPTVVECLLMLLLFEFIRETGIRMPANVGQALSVVGALVIGQAAVEANFISAPMVIVVAVTAITGLTNPSIKGAMIGMRYFLLILSSILGLYGYFFGSIAILIQMLSIKSFGVVYASQFLTAYEHKAQDSIIRMPWWFMKYRPNYVINDRVRSPGKGGKA